MEDDDTDFTPSSPHNTSSNLANLFGFTKKPLQGNSSLTYTAPKAPKKELSPVKKQSEEKTKGKIIFSKAVQAYKLENRNYVSLGLIGIVISGNHASGIYDIILYKRTKDHLCQIRISRSFIITLSANKYVSFYDNNKQNWSVMFQSFEDVEQFSQKVAVCKFYSFPDGPSDILIQELTPPSQQKTIPNSTVEIIYSIYSLTPEELTKVKGEVREEIKLSSYSFTPLSNSLVGSGEKCKRVIIIPRSASGPWLNDLGPNKDLLVEVKLEKIIAELESISSESIPSNDKPLESPNDSSSEEATIKERGVSIKEALTNTKSQKAHLISRMARMGQATLPLKQGLSAGASDSDEENTLTSHPKPRVPRSKNTMSNSLSQPQNLNPEPHQQLAVYQNDLSWQQTQLTKLGIAPQQLMPVSTSPVSSPTTDPNFSIYVSESRIQAAELRMGMSKISEKLDLVWNKVQNLSGMGPENRTHHQQSLLDPSGILTTIQNIITDNENLKEKVEEQKIKIEQQNERIFNLLELNHKYLEQNSTSHDKQSANESKLRTELESLQRKKLEVEAENKVALDRVQNLEENLAKSEQLSKELRKKIEQLDVEGEVLKRNLTENNDDKAKELERMKEKMGKASETVAKLKEMLREVVTENESLKSVIKAQKHEIESGNEEVKVSRTKKEKFEKEVEDLKKQILDGETRSESKIESLSKVVSRLEEENRSLRGVTEMKKDAKEIKDIFMKVFSRLREEFSESKEYSGSYVLTTIGKLLDAETNGGFNCGDDVLVDSKPVEPEEKKESEKEETKEPNPPKEVDLSKVGKKESDNQKNEVDNRYKSYDQGWRTAKPPPPNLFDDDDEDEWSN